MDFSQFNSAEQAHMSRILEQKQVSILLTERPRCFRGEPS